MDEQTRNELNELKYRVAVLEELLVAALTVYGRRDEIRALTAASRGEEIGAVRPATLRAMGERIDALLRGR